MYPAINLLAREHRYPISLFRLFYRLFGLYIFSYSLFLLPLGTLIYSDQGYLPFYELNKLPSWLSLLSVNSSPLAVFLSLGALTIIGGLMVFEIYSPVVSIIGWMVYISLQNRNFLTMHPGSDIIGFLFVAIIIILLYKRYFPTTNSEYLPIPSILYQGSWVLLGWTFTASGIDRLRGDAWVSGTGFADFLSIIPLQDNFLSLILYHAVSLLPATILTLITWFVLLTFISALPLSLWKKGRFYLLGILSTIFLGVLIVSDLTQVALALFLFFLFLSDVYFENARKVYRKNISGWMYHFHMFANRFLPFSRARGSRSDSKDTQN